MVGVRHPVERKPDPAVVRSWPPQPAARTTPARRTDWSRSQRRLLERRLIAWLLVRFGPWDGEALRKPDEPEQRKRHHREEQDGGEHDVSLTDVVGRRLEEVAEP